MKNLNTICMSALILGAAAIATPAMAQAADNQAAQASPSATNTPAAQAAESPASQPANTQVAAGDQASTHDMDTKAAANANVDSVGNTSKKYVRSHRAKDFTKEQSITAQLNQQASAAAAPSNIR
jgi:hypothetical protein